MRGMSPQESPELLARIRYFIGSEPIAKLRSEIEASAANVVQDAIAIQSIPAPTFDELERAKDVERRFRDIGLKDVSVDNINNVYGRLPGRDLAAPVVLVSAHLDTVFPADVELTVREDLHADRMYGPGLGDNSLGL